MKAESFHTYYICIISELLMSESRGKITARVWSGRVHSLFIKIRSPPYSFAPLIDPRMINS